MQFAHQDGAGFAQFAHRRGVAHAFGKLPNPRRRALDIELVFHCEGYAVHRPAPIAFGDLRFSARAPRPARRRPSN